MTPEAADFLAKARGDLEDARKILGISLAAVAARSSYYAAFHAAEALIFELTGKVGKTHAGVRTEFARLLKDIPGHDRALLTFLAQAYKFKDKRLRRRPECNYYRRGGERRDRQSRRVYQPDQGMAGRRIGPQGLPFV